MPPQTEQSCNKRSHIMGKAKPSQVTVNQRLTHMHNHILHKSSQELLPQIMNNQLHKRVEDIPGHAFVYFLGLDQTKQSLHSGPNQAPSHSPSLASRGNATPVPAGSSKARQIPGTLQWNPSPSSLGHAGVPRNPGDL